MTTPSDILRHPEEGVLLRRQVGGRQIDLTELLFGRYALNVGRAGADWYDAQYTYDVEGSTLASLGLAAGELARWNGVQEPSGWVRAVVDGQPTRRRPGGDAAWEEERE